MLLAVPALRALRRAAPGEPLALAAQPRIGGLLVELGVGDRAIDYDRLGLAACFVESGGPPALPEVERARRVVCWFGARDPVFVRALSSAAPGAVVAAPTGEGEPVWRHLRRTVGAETGGDDEVIDRSPALVAEGQRVLRAAGWNGAAPVALLHPGAGGVAKRWPAKGFASIARSLLLPRGMAVVVHRGPADGAAADALCAALPPGTPRLEEPSLPELAGALGHAAVYVGNDSGVSHLAAAVGAPSLVLFTPPHLAWRPWSRAARTATVSTDAVVEPELARVLASVRALLA